MFLKDEDKKFVREKLSKMSDKVKIVFFTQQLECSFCKETHQLLEELTGLSDKLSLETYNFQIDKKIVEKYGVNKIPAVVLLRKDGTDTGIKFYGIPSGYEFSSLLEDIIDISNRKHGVSDNILRELEAIDKPVHIQVLLTPTCPYCPSAVRTAHRLALANKNITADMIEATEFPYLSQKYSIRGVPKSVINENWSLEGAVPEQMFVEKINESLK
ncbi:MAG: thioredoxin family protein [Candidatus Marinimicrobia bacterium]|nr:thioredoxin family protein [Candidatus Neomarinimicrobiota bacterium]